MIGGGGLAKVGLALAEDLLERRIREVVEQVLTDGDVIAKLRDALNAAGPAPAQEPPREPESTMGRVHDLGSRSSNEEPGKGKVTVLGGG